MADLSHYCYRFCKRRRFREIVCWRKRENHGDGSPVVQDGIRSIDESGAKLPPDGEVSEMGPARSGTDR
jgi:hypothetical protein